MTLLSHYVNQPISPIVKTVVVPPTAIKSMSKLSTRFSTVRLFYLIYTYQCMSFMLMFQLVLYLVTPAVQEPVPGWVDNMNGPTGVLIGAGKGVIRSILCNGELKSEIIPVDIAINGIILLPYHNTTNAEKPAHIPVYNLTVSEEKKHTWKWILEVGRQHAIQYPFEVGLWYPDGGITMNKFYHWFCVVMFMWLPAYLIDMLLTIFRQKRFMVRVQTKIATGLEVLQFFTTRAWDFKSRNFQHIYNELSSSDRQIFKITTDDIDDTEYLRTCILGGRQYVMKEPPSSLPRSRAQLKVLYCLDRFCKTVILGGLAYWICLKLGVVALVRSSMGYVTLKEDISN